MTVRYRDVTEGLNTRVHWKIMEEVSMDCEYSLPMLKRSMYFFIFFCGSIGQDIQETYNTPKAEHISEAQFCYCERKFSWPIRGPLRKAALVCLQYHPPL